VVYARASLAWSKKVLDTRRNGLSPSFRSRYSTYSGIAFVRRPNSTCNPPFRTTPLAFLLHLLLRWDNQIVVGTVYCSDVDEWYEPFEVIN